MSRKGENIYKRKDGRWEGRYLKRIPGEKTKYGYVYAPTYREARAKLHQATTAWNKSHAKAEVAVLFSKVAQQWESHIIPQVKESTAVKYHSTIEKHLLPRLADVQLSEFTHQRIEILSLELMRSLAPRTVSDILSVLRSILRFAQLQGVYVPCDGSTVRIRHAPTQVRVLSPGEQEVLTRHLQKDLTPRNVGILLSLFTGLRVGEICALRWDDISLPDRTLHVRRTMQRLRNLSPDGPRTRIVITEPKSAHSIRTIPLTQELVRILHTVPGQHIGYFLTGSEETFTEPRTLQYYFDHVTQACGIDHVNYHALRHTFATRCVELGFDIKCLSELLGHSTVTMTMDRYVHPTMEHKRNHMQRLTPVLLNLDGY